VKVSSTLYRKTPGGSAPYFVGEGLEKERTAKRYAGVQFRVKKPQHTNTTPNGRQKIRGGKVKQLKQKKRRRRREIRIGGGLYLLFRTDKGGKTAGNILHKYCIYG